MFKENEPDEIPLAAQGPAAPQLRLHRADEQVAASPPPLPPHFAPLRLVLQASGATVEVDRPDMLVGRHTEADIRLPLPDVSRRHCRLVFGEAGWQVIDLNSLNGTEVNGEQVLQAPLVDGDSLRIGGFTFSVELPARKRESIRSIVETLAATRRKAS